MNTRFVAAVAAGSATMLIAGFLLYGLLFAPLFREGALMIPGVMKTTPEITWILAGQLGMGVLLTLVVSWRGNPTLTRGATTGALFGLLLAIGYDFAQYGTSNLWTLQATLADPFITAMMMGVAGSVIGLILGRGNPAGNRAGAIVSEIEPDA